APEVAGGEPEVLGKGVQVGRGRIADYVVEAVVLLHDDEHVIEVRHRRGGRLRRRGRGPGSDGGPGQRQARHHGKPRTAAARGAGWEALTMQRGTQRSPYAL